MLLDSCVLTATPGRWIMTPSHARSCCLAVTLLLACSGEPSSVSREDELAPHLVGVVDEAFARQANDSGWGTISGVAVEKSGDIAVSDGKNNHVFILRPTGAVKLVL